MSEQGTVKPSAPVVEDRTFGELLGSLVGKTVTIVNPESYEDAPVGHQIRVGFSKAKPIAIGKDYVVLVTEFVHKGKDANKDREPVKQYLPIHRIKRISILKSERLIHI